MEIQGFFKDYSRTTLLECDNTHTHTQRCRPKDKTRGGGCVVGNMWTTPLTTPTFCKYDNNVLFKPVHVKVLKQGESEYTVVAFFFY